MKNNKLPEWNPAKMAEPTDFMTYEEFVERLKQDLDITDKNWWVYDFQTPHNESEYQNELKLLQKIMHK